MKVQLSDHFTYSKLIRYALPTVVMMVFTSIYSIVDGLFVSNYAGKVPFAAINIIFPALMIISTLGFMIGAGGGALVGMRLGEGKKEEANELFSMLVAMSFVLGVIATVAAYFFIEEISILLGADEVLLPYCIRYAQITLLSMPMFILQASFHTYFITANKPGTGLAVTVASGCMNIVLDFVLVGLVGMGLEGAAWATAASEVTGGLLPVLYFARKNTSLLKLTKFRLQPRLFLRSCANGVAELLSGIANSFITILYNRRLLGIAGTDGVAAYSAIMYIGFIFYAMLRGYSIGAAPIVSFHYGKGDRGEVTGVLKKSLTTVGITGILMALTAEAAAAPFSKLFVGYDQALYEMTLNGFRIHGVGFVLLGIGVFGTSFFTAIGSGGISAVISSMRTFICPVIFVYLLPSFMGINGVWASGVVTEVLSAALVTVLLVVFRGKYLPRKA